MVYARKFGTKIIVEKPNLRRLSDLLRPRSTGQKLKISRARFPCSNL
jgi:hypothetical protein